MEIALPYGKGRLAAALPGGRVRAVLRPRALRPPERAPAEQTAAQAGLVAAALENPVGSPPLEALVRGRRRVTVLISDHTRPVPSRLLLPPLLAAVRRGNPAAEITLLVATGCHRGTTAAELADKLGPEVYGRERVAVHDCADEENLVSLGRLPSGGALRVNRLAAEADLLLAEGFIEPHFFAGYSGGRKSVLPGVAGRESVLANHCAAFIADPRARAGVLDDNPIHRDMLWAARAAGLAFILNVIIDENRQIAAAFAGDCDAAHRAGTAWLDGRCRVSAPPADIVVTTNNGHPLDQNIYQAVKGMSTAEALVRPGGVIVMAAACGEGHGGEGFLRFFDETPDPAALLARIAAVPAERTAPDQWQAQVLARILCRCNLVLVSEADPALARRFGLHPARDLGEALRLADALGGRPAGDILVIPEGVSVVAAAEGA